MKKASCFLVMLLLCVSVCFAACSKEEAPQEYYTISDFETENELLAMNWKNSFGIVKCNDNARYVKSGSRSARLEIHGDPFQGEGYTPYAIVYTDNAFNKRTDYSDVVAFEFSIFNASDRDQTVKFQFLSQAIYKGGLSSEYSFTLKANEWTDAVVNIDRGFINVFMDLSAISEFYFKFENREAGQTPAVLYLDRFVAKTTNEPIKAPTNIRKAGEIESADRAEYLSAWSVTPNRGGGLSYNTDPKYVREGTASFHFTGSPTGGVNWPEIVLKSNMITDISEYESLYFWWYNDNDKPYDIVTAGGTTMATVAPHEWTLVDMRVSWIANVPNFHGDAKNYDIHNFNNFTISLTNNNETLSFYLDGFYARKAGEGYIGALDPGKDIELSASGVLRPKAGESFTLPTVTNASDYVSVTRTVSKAQQVGGEFKYVVESDLAQAAEFTPEAHTSYVISYKAEDAEGRISTAKVNVLVGGDDALDMTYGAATGLDTFTPTVMNGTYTEITATLNTDAQYNALGTNSVKLHIPTLETTGKAAFTWTPGFNVDTYDYLMFHFYNAGPERVSLISMWGLVIHLEPGQWLTKASPSSQVRSWAEGGSPETHNADKFSISFVTTDLAGNAPADIYFAFSTFGLNEVSPTIELPKTTDIVQKGARVTVPVPETECTWQLYFNDTIVENSNNVTEFVAENYGIYQVRYSKEMGEQTGTAAYTVHVIDPAKLVTINAEDIEADSFGRDLPTFTADGEKLLGADTLHVTGTKEGPDIGFVWNTGVYNDLNEVTIFVYNNSDGQVNLIHSWGMVAPMQPATWTAITIAGAKLSGDTVGWPNTQVGRENNEWIFAFPMNVAATTAYDLSFAFAMDKGEVPSPVIELEKTTDVAEIGSVYTVPVVDGATWKVYVDEQEVTEGVTETGFTVTESAYTVKYEKEQGDQVARAELTVYGVDKTKLTTIGTEDVEEDSFGRILPTFTADGEKLLGADTLHVTGTKEGTDIGFVWNTGVYNDLNEVTIYVYNNSDGNVNLVYAYGAVVILKPQTWTAITIAGGGLNEYKNGWPSSQVGRINNEWIFAFPMNVAATTAYDLSFAIAMDKGEVPSPVIELEKTTDVAEIGSVYTVPVVDGATWKVYVGEQEVTESVTASGFTVTGSAYTVKYEKEQGDQVARAELIVYGVDKTKLTTIGTEDVEEDSFGRILPTFTADGEKLLGVDTLHVTGIKEGPDIGFVWNTGVYNDLNEVTIFVYNNSDGNVNLVYAYGAVATLQPKTWTAVTIAGGQLSGNAGGWPNSQVGRRNNEWLFAFPMNVAATTAYDLSFAFAMDRGTIPSPVIELEKTTDVVELGNAYTVPVVDGATWKVYVGEQEVTEGVTETGFTVTGSAYTVKYEKEQGDQVARAELTVYGVDKTKLTTIGTEDVEEDSFGRILPTFTADGEKLLGADTLHVTGTKTGPDIGFVWNTGVYNDLNEVTIYVYNNSDGNVNLVHSYGAVVILKPQTWTAITIAGGGLNEYKNGWPNSQVGRRNNEWLFAFPMNVAATTAYDLSFAFAMDKGEVPSPVIELEKTSDVAEIGSTYTVPVAEDATWKVYVDEQEVTEGVTETGFTVTGNTYTIKYTKQQGDQTARAELTVYVVDKTKLVEMNAQDTEGDSFGRIFPTFSADGMQIAGADTLRVAGTKTGPDIGFVWNTGVYNDLNEVTIYVYNNSDGNVNLVHSYGAVVILKPQTWTAITIAGGGLNEYKNGWPNSQVGRIDNEWLFAFPMNVAATTAYDLSFAIAMDKGTIPSPVIALEKTTDVAEKGAAYTVPVVKNATWKVYADEQEVTEGVTETGFTVTGNTYTVKYTKQQGDQTAQADLTVYGVDKTKLVAMNAQDTEADSFGRILPTIEAGGMQIAGADTLHVTGTKTGPDIGFVWYTGMYNDLNEATIYVYNNSDGAVVFVYSYGAVATLQPKTWTAVTIAGGQLSGNAGGWPNSQVGRIDNEWLFAFPMNVAATTAYDLSFAIAMDRGTMPSPVITLPKTTDVAEKGATYTVPVVRNVTWKVYAGEQEVTEGVTETGFTVTGSAYTIKYTKQQGDQTAQAELTVYGVDKSKLVAANAENIEEDLFGRIYPTITADGEKIVGVDTLHATGTKTGPDIGFVWNTGITDNLNEVTIYVYNNSDGAVNLVHSWGMVAALQPKTWTAITIAGAKLSGDTTGWPNSQVGRKDNGEWVFGLPMNVAATTAYDLSFAFAFDIAQ